MTCGHRGIPPRTEEKRVSRLLRKSGFIPMLETLAEQANRGGSGARLYEAPLQQIKPSYAVTGKQCDDQTPNPESSSINRDINLQNKVASNDLMQEIDKMNSDAHDSSKLAFQSAHN